MSNVLPFKKPAVKPKGLCQHGFHRWKILQKQKFDVHEGKLVTVYECERCGEKKVKAQ
jgi:hypothetical protein